MLLTEFPISSSGLETRVGKLESDYNTLKSTVDSISSSGSGGSAGIPTIEGTTNTSSFVYVDGLLIHRDMALNTPKEIFYVLERNVADKVFTINISMIAIHFIEVGGTLGAYLGINEVKVNSNTIVFNGQIELGPLDFSSKNLTLNTVTIGNYNIPTKYCSGNASTWYGSGEATITIYATQSHST